MPDWRALTARRLMEGVALASGQESSWHHQAQGSRCHTRLWLAKAGGPDAVLGRGCLQSSVRTAGHQLAFEGCTETPRNSSDPDLDREWAGEEGWYFKTSAGLLVLDKRHGQWYGKKHILLSVSVIFFFGTQYYQQNSVKSYMGTWK